MREKGSGRYLPLATALVTAFLLAMVQWKVERPVILLERFMPHGGWVEIPFIALYAAIIAHLMRDIGRSAKV